MNEAPKDETPRARLWRNYRSSKMAMFGLVTLVVILLAALFAPVIAPQNPYDLMAVDLMDSRLEPGQKASAGNMTYLLGTDEQGRDLVSAILYGVRISVIVGLTSASLAAILGVSLGLWAGYAGGRIDSVIMRITEMQLSFPAMLIALVLLALTGTGIDKIIISMVAVQWAWFARTARGAAIIERRKEYIEAATALGLSPTRIVLRHLLPNCLPPLIVIAPLSVAGAISLEASLSFLGLGLPITEPSLGLLVSNGSQYMLSGKYWISFFPGLALLIMVLSIKMVGAQLGDVLNPRLQTQ